MGQMSGHVVEFTVEWWEVDKYGRCGVGTRRLDRRPALTDLGGTILDVTGKVPGSGAGDEGVQRPPGVRSARQSRGT